MPAKGAGGRRRTNGRRRRPYVASIEESTELNRNFRRTAFTGAHLQLVLMSIPPGGEVGEEVHRATDQFFRVESGIARLIIDGTEWLLRSGDGIVVPAGSHHNIINRSKKRPLQMYTVYAPPKHTAHCRQPTRQSKEC
jgi:mannose-6-phosphate isomerase-like protein (cupin superfamily)